MVVTTRRMAFIQLVLLVTLNAPTTHTTNTIVHGVDFFGFDSDSQSEEVADPCHYDSSILIGPENVERCLDRVKRLAADTGLYWFGGRWKTTCSSSTSSKLASSNAVACYNPPKLQRYESLAARILRVPTFDMAYLRNLKIFPQLIFTSSPGQYVACDHVFGSDVDQEIVASPYMDPAPPWHVRRKPMIKWSSPSFQRRRSPFANDEEEENYILVMVDVGFGDLYYLAYNYPSDTTSVREYSGPLNFRDSSNPVALLVFRQTSPIRSIDWQSALEDDSSFNVQKFMIKNNLTQSWVGLNWLNVGTDGYAIEEQRRTSFVDNCALLIRNRIFSPLDRVKLKFLPNSALLTVDTWMTVTFTSMETSFTLCCKGFTFEQSTVQLDPLGDKELRPVYMKNAPTVSVSHIAPPMVSELRAYRRFSRRDYMTVPDEGYYTLLILDTDSSPSGNPTALWLVINIKGSYLHEFTDDKPGLTTVLPYMAPLPTGHGLHRYLILLFRQQGPIAGFELKHYSPKTCKTKFVARCSFNVAELMARNGLTLKSLNWALSRQDEYVQYEMVRKGEWNQRKLCPTTGAHYEEHCQPVAVQIVSADGRVRVNSASAFHRHTLGYFRISRTQLTLLLASLFFILGS